MLIPKRILLMLRFFFHVSLMVFVKKSLVKGVVVFFIIFANIFLLKKSLVKSF
jgi:hypothetical protein